MSIGFVPNLRALPALADTELWKDILLGGTLSENGMPNFGEILSTTDAEAIREYVFLKPIMTAIKTSTKACHFQISESEARYRI